MTPAEFRALIAAADDTDMLDMTLRSDDAPFVFDGAPERWTDFKDSLVTQLSIEPDGIRIVGSGRLGFSLKPDANLKPFRDKSDIDLVLVSTSAFDEIWRMLLHAAYPRPPVVLSKNLIETRNELYPGFLTPLEIRFDLNLRLPPARTSPFLDYRLNLFNTLQTASKLPTRKHETINCRVYKSWHHAELYTLDSIKNLKRYLARSGQP